MATGKQKREWAAAFAIKIAKDSNIVATKQTCKNFVLGAKAKAGFAAGLWCGGFVSAIAAYTDKNFNENNRVFDSAGANAGKPWSMNVKDARIGMAVSWKIRPANPPCRNGGHIALVVGVREDGIITVGGNEGIGQSTKSLTQGGGIVGPRFIPWEKVEKRNKDVNCPCYFSGYRKLFAEGNDTLGEPGSETQIASGDENVINSGQSSSSSQREEDNGLVALDMNEIWNNTDEPVGRPVSNISNAKSTQKNPEIVTISNPNKKDLSGENQRDKQIIVLNKK